MAPTVGDILFVDTSVLLMLTHGIATLVTQNAEDFAWFNEIDLVTVTDVAVGG